MLSGPKMASALSTNAYLFSPVSCSPFPYILHSLELGEDTCNAILCSFLFGNAMTLRYISVAALHPIQRLIKKWIQ